MDFISKRYGYLPSEVYSKADSLDIKVAEFAIAYEVYQSEKQLANSQGKPTVSRQYTTEQLASMLAQVKQGAKNDSKTSKK